MSPSMTTEATPGVGFSLPLPPTPPRPSLFLKTAPTNQCRRRPASAIKMAFSSLPSLRDGSRVIDRQKKNTKKNDDDAPGQTSSVNDRSVSRLRRGPQRRPLRPRRTRSTDDKKKEERNSGGKKK